MISVCAPYWCRQDALDRMAEMYTRLYPRLDIELSICDDGSPEPAVVPEGVTLTRLPAKPHALNPCVPINAAVAASSGDIVVLTNPEVEHREPVLPALLAALGDVADYVSARCWDDGRRTWLAHESMRYQARLPRGAHFHFLAAFSRELWERAGGFDEDYRYGKGYEDADWLQRAAAAGATFRLADAVVYHETSRTRWGLPSNRPLYMSKWSA